MARDVVLTLWLLGSAAAAQEPAPATPPAAPPTATEAALSAELAESDRKLAELRLDLQRRTEQKKLYLLELQRRKQETAVATAEQILQARQIDQQSADGALTRTKRLHRSDAATEEQVRLAETAKKHADVQVALAESDLQGQKIELEILRATLELTNQELRAERVLREFELVQSRSRSGAQTLGWAKSGTAVSVADATLAPDDPILALWQERLRVLKRRATLADEVLARTNPQLTKEEAFAAWWEAEQAALELATTPAERIPILEGAIERLRQQEKVSAQLRGEENFELLGLQAKRLQLEIDLAQTRRRVKM